MTGRRRHRPTPSRSAYELTVTLGTCPCGKARHASRKAAKSFARLHHPAGGLRPYECPTAPGTWHLGTLPAPVIDGRQPRTYAGQAPR